LIEIEEYNKKREPKTDSLFLLIAISYSLALIVPIATLLKLLPELYTFNNVTKKPINEY